MTQQHALPPPGMQPEPSYIAVTTRTPPLGAGFTFVKPKLFVNGYEVPAVWGRNVIPMPPGRHHVHVHVPFLLPPRIGPTDITVTTAPGQVVELEYREPHWSFSRGSLGPPPQKSQGLAISIAVMVGFVSLALLCSGAAVFAAATL
jgi:hypothetical protein